MVCYPLDKKRVERKVVKPDFVQFIFIFTVEVMRVCDYFDDFLDDAGW
jgi:hypothetical protein